MLTTGQYSQLHASQTPTLRSHVPILPDCRPDAYLQPNPYIRPAEMASAAHMPADASRDKNLVQVLHRVTVEHRHLWYQLSVLQQPERARACGAGVKANSDRRPVDPPPVVELKIFEGPSIEEGKHITFDYKANFFVYASLEHARTIAHGRVQTPAANCPPILSGVPATGMAYLDRPSEAGYFIFPDLSVRHEGNYCLNFSLFETTKDKNDYDVNLDPDMPPGVDFRMEIKTKPFTVYSAKKFPGLMESTELSKMVADQGCRVRIRRDVRMRKRDKSTRDYDRREEDYARRRTVTPATDDPHGLRPRSVSNSSEHRMPYPDPQRRPSIAESYPSAPPPPPPGFDGPPLAARSHLSFGDPRAPQYAAPSQYAPHPPPLQVAPISPGGPYTPGAQSPHIKPDPSYSYRHSSRPMPQAPSPSQSIKAEYARRSSGTYMPPSPTTYSPTEPHSRRESYSSYPATPISAQPLPRMHIKPAATAPQMSISALVSPAAPIEAQTEPELPPPSVSTGGKRKHDYVFPQSSAPLHNGRRPLDPTHAESRRLLATPGTYPRADGTVEIAHFNEYTYN